MKPVKDVAKLLRDARLDERRRTLKEVFAAMATADNELVSPEMAVRAAVHLRRHFREKP